MRMLNLFWQPLILLGKLLLFLIWLAVYQPVRLLGRLVDEISGTGPKSRQLRSMFQERAALSASAFVKDSGIVPEKAPICLAVRRAVAELSHLPEGVIYPDDDLATLRLMMEPTPDAPWYDMGSDWADVVDWVGMILRVDIPKDSEFETHWLRAKSRGELRTVHQLAELLIEVIRNHYDLSQFNWIMQRSAEE